MPGPSGLDLLKVHGRSLPVVLVTAYPDHALEAFDGAAIDYLLKPVTEERLAQTLARLTAVIGLPAPLPPATASRRIPVKAGGGTLFLEFRKISHFLVENNSVYAFSQTGERLPTQWKALAEVECLYPDMIRIHRNLLVRRDSILGFRVMEDGRLLLRMQGGIELESSRPAAPRIRAELGLKREKAEDNTP